MKRTPAIVDRIDHIVLTVADIAVTCQFYARVPGMQEIRFGTGRIALAFGRQKINLHAHGKEFEPTALRPTPGSTDLCLIASTPLADVAERLAENGVHILEGPVARTGAEGKMVSIYFRDPDGNLVEASNYH
jgi:catechol 2,3-dioxygenase-like lactoylglutathione lyase family enzyme